MYTCACRLRCGGVADYASLVSVSSEYDQRYINTQTKQYGVVQPLVSESALEEYGYTITLAQYITHTRLSSLVPRLSRFYSIRTQKEGNKKQKDA